MLKIPTISEWANKQQQKSKRFVSVFHTLFASPNRYLWYRLRFASLNALILFTINIIETYLIFKNFNIHVLFIVILLNFISLIVISTWWGCTEILRTRIRTFHAEKKVHLLIKERNNWLILSILATFLVMGIYLLLLITLKENVFSQIYLCILMLNLMMVLPVKTLHSSVYAIRRIYRPFISLSMSAILSLLTLIVAYPFIGIWSLLVAKIVGSVSGASLTFYYVVRMLKRLRQPIFKRYPFKKHMKIFFVFIKKFSSQTEFVLAGLAGALLCFESLLIPLLLLESEKIGGEKLLLGIYLLLPLIEMGYSWARLFYFDLKRFQALWQRQIFHPFFRKITYLSLLIGVIAWIGSLPVLLLAPHIQALEITLMLLFFTCRSLLAYQQIRRFCEWRYYDVILSTLFLMPLALLFIYEIPPLPIILTLFILGFIISSLFLRHPRFKSVQDIPPVEYFYYADWALKLKRHFLSLKSGKKIFVLKLHLDGDLLHFNPYLLIALHRLPWLHTCSLTEKLILLFYSEHRDPKVEEKQRQIIIQTAGICQIKNWTTIEKGEDLQKVLLDLLQLKKSGPSLFNSCKKKQIEITSLDYYSENKDFFKVHQKEIYETCKEYMQFPGRYYPLKIHHDTYLLYMHFQGEKLHNIQLVLVDGLTGDEVKNGHNHYLEKMTESLLS